MLDQLYIIHRTHLGDMARDLTFSSPDWLVWNTCLRQLLIGHESFKSQVQIHPNDKVYCGAEAYRFLLEVVCGLHSPMLGETEVFGQFRKKLDEVPESDNFYRIKLKTLLDEVKNDAKVVRQKFLQKLGSQSYGSVIRRFIPLGEKVSFIGAGQLVQEITPWLRKSASEITVYCRNVERAAGHEVLSDLHICVLNDSAPISGHVIICAPLSAQEICSHLDDSSQRGRLIIDLRGDSSTDPLPKTLPVKDLGLVFSEVQNNKIVLNTRVSKTKNYIDNLIRQKQVAVQVRPFGWEDICV